MRASASEARPQTAERTAQAVMLDSLGRPSVPYRGIESFRLVDRLIFCARKPDVRSIFRLLTIYRAIILSGDSGVGKSSLLNAGLIPTLIEDGSRVERLRVQPLPSSEFLIERLSLNDDGKAPFLPSIFVDDESTQSKVPISAQDFVARIRNCFEASSGPDHAAPLVLLCDQFEESVTLFEEAPENRTDYDQNMKLQAVMLEALAELIRDEELPVKLLFAMREDYLPKVQRLFDPFYPQIKTQVFALQQLKEDDLQAIITGPYQAKSRTGENLFDRQVSETACKYLEQGLSAKSDNGFITLTEAQIACRAVWDDSEEESAFVKMGAEVGVVQAVEHLFDHHMDNAMRTLPEPLRRPARLTLTKLVTSRGTRNIVSEDNLLRDLQQGGIAEQEAQDVLTKLVEESRLIYRQARGETPFVEIVSESLIPWIIKQQALFKEEQRLATEEAEQKKRVEELKKEERLQGLLAQTRAKEAKKAEEQLLKIKRARLWAVVFGLVAFLTIVVVSLSTAQKDQRAREELAKASAAILMAYQENANVQAAANAREEELAAAKVASEKLRSELAKSRTELGQLSALNARLSVEAQKLSKLAQSSKLQNASDVTLATRDVESAIQASGQQIAVTQAKLDSVGSLFSDLGWVTGKIRTFGGPDDNAASPSEGLALITTPEEMRDSKVFMASASPPPKVRNLDTATFYMAARWDYKDTPKNWLQTHKVKVRNNTTRKVIEAQAVDWGPMPSTGAVMDLSPGLANALGLKVNDVASYYIEKPQASQLVKTVTDQKAGGTRVIAYTMTGINDGQTRAVPGKPNWYVWVGKLSRKDQREVECRVFTTATPPATWYAEAEVTDKLKALEAKVMPPLKIGKDSPLSFSDSSGKKYTLVVTDLSTGLFKNDHVDLELREQ